LRSVGIDIGSLSIKVADVELVGRSLILRDFLEVPYSLDITMDKKIQVLESLRRVAAHYDPSTTKFVVGISQDRISVRKKPFPFREKLKILKSLPFELEDEIPFDQARAIYDVKLIKYAKNFSDVLACATPNKYIEEILQITNDAGIDPDIISTDGFALANLFTNWWLPPPEADSLTSNSVMVETSESGAEPHPVASSDLYLHFGHSKTILFVLQNQYLIETRCINVGGLEIVKAIQKTYGISYADALKGLQEKGFILTKNDGASKDQISFSNTIQGALEPLLLEIKKTMLELESQNNISIQNILIMGGGSHLINMTPYLTQKLGVITNPLSYLTNGIKVYAQQTPSLEKNSAVAVGLAIEGLKRPKNPAINFRKGPYAKDGASLSSFFQKWKKTFQYAAAALVVFTIYSYTRATLSNNLIDKAREALKTVAQSPTVGLKGAQTREIAIKKYISEKKKEITDYQKLSDMKVINSPMDVMNKISQVMPQKNNFSIDVRELSVQNEMVQLSGEISTMEQLGVLKSLLRNLSVDKKLQEIPGTAAANGKISFNLQFKMDRKTLK